MSVGNSHLRPALSPLTADLMCVQCVGCSGLYCENVSALEKAVAAARSPLGSLPRTCPPACTSAAPLPGRPRAPPLGGVIPEAGWSSALNRPPRLCSWRTLLSNRKCPRARVGVCVLLTMRPAPMGAQACSRRSAVSWGLLRPAPSPSHLALQFRRLRGREQPARRLLCPPGPAVVRWV